MSLLKELAMEQLNDVVVAKVYANLEPGNCGLRIKDNRGQSFEDYSSLLFDRIEKLQIEVKSLDRASWSQDFIQKCKILEEELRDDWDTNWKKCCNAKRLLNDLQSRQKLKVSISALKTEIMKEMRLQQTEEWRIMNSQLVDKIK
jgi:hypothetical protein